MKFCPKSALNRGCEEELVALSDELISLKKLNFEIGNRSSQNYQIVKS